MKRFAAVLLALFMLPAEAATITATWDVNVPGATMNIERCTGAGCSNFAPLVSVPADGGRYADTTVVLGTTYCYRASQQMGTGKPSLYTLSIPPCVAPAAAQIAIVPLNPTFTGVSGGALPLPVTVTITTSNAVAWASKDTCSFFDVSATSGASGSAQILTVNAAGWNALPVGTQTCSITYTATDANPTALMVTATKTAPPTPAPANLRVTP